MKLQNILDYFKTPEAANKVLEQIKGLGVNEIQIDRFGRYSLGSADQFMNPLTSDLKFELGTCKWLLWKM